MQKHFNLIRSKQKATTWSSKLITYGIKFLYKIWDTRNQQLHKTARIQDMEGIPLLLQSIQNELNIGLGRLPAYEYSSYLKVPMQVIQQKPPEWQKHWFLVIRQARLLLDADNLISDEFASSSTLQKWIGLSYSITDEEATPVLHRAIINELNIGISNLPLQPFLPYFQLSHTDLINQSSLTHLKTWLKTIRQGRLKFNHQQIIQDEFNHHGLYNQWLYL